MPYNLETTNLYGCELFEALKTAIHYNGLEEVLQTWKDRSGLEEDEYGQLFRKYALEREKYDLKNTAQIEIIWMICVLLFGNYGTSPRSGWIEKIKDFDVFIDDLIASSY